MKLSSLLAQRQRLLQQARLANLAFAYDRLSDYTQRLARTRFAGEVRLQRVASAAETGWPTLTALQGSQAVIEEHFTDEDLMDLADIIAYATGENDLDLTFRIEDLSGRFLTPLRVELEQIGITIDPAGSSGEGASHEGSAGCSQADENG